MNPTNNIVFKKVFGVEARKHLLISFLNAVLKFEGMDKIASLTLADPYQVPKLKDLKETVLDIKAMNEKGEQFIVEMQVRNKGDFEKRALYYSSKAYIGQLNAGKNYDEMKPVYFVGIMGYTLRKEPAEKEHYLSKWVVKNVETNTHGFKDFSFHFIELPKFKKKLEDVDGIIEQRIWFLKNTEGFKKAPDNFNELLKEAFDVVEMHNFSQQEMDAIDYREREEAVNYGRGYKEGEKKGRENGKKEGMEKAIENLMEKQSLSREQAENILL